MALTYKDGLGDTQHQPGWLKGDEFHSVELSARGKPIPTGEVLIPEPEKGDVVRALLRWGGGFKGIVELTYPHPKGWTL